MPEQASAARAFRFGVFELDLERRELRRRGSVVPLPPQAFAVLLELVSRRGELVTREELRRLLWRDDHDANRELGLNYCVNRVRRALGDVAQTSRYLETLPKRGYRFLAAVDTFPACGAAMPSPSDPLPTPHESPRTGRRPPRLAARPLLVAAAAILITVQEPAPRPRSEAGKPGLPSLDLAAQAAFTKGRRLLDEGPTGWRRSIAFFGEAARRDGGFALARYGLADAYMRLGEHGVLAVDEAFPAARQAALDALEIEDRAEPLVILAALKLDYEWDWRASERATRRALALDPDLTEARLFYARLLSAAGRHDEALRTIGEVEARRPDCAPVVRDAALVRYRARRYDEAARRFRDWAELEPKLRDPHHWLAQLLHLQGRSREAVGEARIVLTLAEARADYLQRFDSLEPALAMDFYLQGCLRYLQHLAASQSVTPDDFARLRAQLGEHDSALRDLERAAEERSPRLLPSLQDPVFDPLRSDSRFQALQQRVHQPAASGGA
jgi:DNA-binding winged helix-turn-helix (wHTH) protein